jgi:hypothetical protein
LKEDVFLQDNEEELKEVLEKEELLESEVELDINTTTSENIFDEPLKVEETETQVESEDSTESEKKDEKPKELKAEILTELSAENENQEPNKDEPLKFSTLLKDKVFFQKQTGSLLLTKSTKRSAEDDNLQNRVLKKLKLI